LCEISVAEGEARKMHIAGKDHDHLKNRIMTKFYDFTTKEKWGDWFCAGKAHGCLTQNFAKLEECHKCQAKKNLSAGTMRLQSLIRFAVTAKPEEGQWLCTTCLVTHGEDDKSCSTCSKSKKECQHKPAKGLF
jgi:hypothetical protein